MHSARKIHHWYPNLRSSRSVSIMVAYLDTAIVSLDRDVFNFDLLTQVVHCIMQ